MVDSHRMLVSLILLGTMCFAGCASRPDEQIQLAEAAKKEAMEQRAPNLAPGDWQKAEEAWTEAQELLLAEQFASASTALLRAKSRFEKARDIAKSKRDVILRDARNMEKTVGVRYGRFKEEMEGSRLSSKEKKSLEELCLEIEKGIEQFKAFFDEGDYTAARDGTNSTMRMVVEAEKTLNKYTG